MTLINMSIVAGVMIVLGMLIRYFTLAKISKATFVFIWMLAMIRLLIPFELPFGINFFDRITEIQLIDSFEAPPFIASTSYAFITPTNSIVSPEPLNQINIMIWIWILGMMIGVVYFIVNHVKFLRWIRDSTVIENEFTRQFMNEYQPRLKRKIQIRQSQKTISPLTYGVIKPVILIPKTFDWNESNQLEYIFAHEYIHVKRFDCFIKIIATLALCIHWFNPLVWAMYVLLHRDIELSCDEKVLQLFGEQIKSTYALALIDLAEKQSNLIPTYSYFSKHIGIEERIKMIAKMKIGKKSIIGATLAIMVVGGAMVAFASDRSETQTPSSVNETPNQLVYVDDIVPEPLVGIAEYTELAVLMTDEATLVSEPILDEDASVIQDSGDLWNRNDGTERCYDEDVCRNGSTENSTCPNDGICPNDRSQCGRGQGGRGRGSQNGHRQDSQDSCPNTGVCPNDRSQGRQGNGNRRNSY